MSFESKDPLMEKSSTPYDEVSLEEEASSSEHNPGARRRRRCFDFCTVFIPLSISFNIILLTALLHFLVPLLSSHTVTRETLYCKPGPICPSHPSLTPFPAPAQDVLKYRIQKFSQGFGDSSSLPIYQQPPSPAVDAAWEALYHTTLGIPRSHAQSLPNATVAANHDASAPYMVSLSVFHVLHCLDSVRKTVFHLAAGKSLAEIEHMMPGHGSGSVEMHLGHCIDAIRQQLMCDADVTPIVWQWDESVGDVRVYANTVHVCRNYDDILEWGRDHVWTEGIESGGKRLEEVGKCDRRDPECRSW
jgi:hypothetical protein